MKLDFKMYAELTNDGRITVMLDVLVDGQVVNTQSIDDPDYISETFDLAELLDSQIGYNSVIGNPKRFYRKSDQNRVKKTFNALERAVTRGLKKSRAKLAKSEVIRHKKVK